MPRIAAIDFGMKRIGIAISDEKARIALPLKMILAGKNIKETIQNLLRVLSLYSSIDTILVGLPLLLSGKEGEMAKLAKNFADALQKETTATVKMIDERLTTAQAERSLKELSYSRKNRSQIVDSTSATILLQTFLDSTYESS